MKNHERSTAMNAGIIYPINDGELTMIQVGPGNKNEAAAMVGILKVKTPLEASQNILVGIRAEKTGLGLQVARTQLIVEDAVTRALDNAIADHGRTLESIPQSSSQTKAERAA